MQIEVINHHDAEDRRVSYSTVNTDHDDAILAVKWNWLTFDPPVPLVAVRDLLVGDTVYTLHKGKAVITEVLNGFLRFNGEQNLFAVEEHTKFPLASRGDHDGSDVHRFW